MEKNYFADNLRVLRKAHKMTLKDVAKGNKYKGKCREK